MQRLILGIAIAALVSVLGAEARRAKAATAAAAQIETKTETKVKMKGGKDVHLTGCVEPASGPASYMLTDVVTSEKTPDIVHNYYLVGKTDDLEKHIGHVMEIEGKAFDRGKGEGAPLPFLDVASIKLLRGSCS